MIPASESHIPDGLLAANVLLSEKPHQGSRTYSGTLHQGFHVAISSTSLGIIGTLYDGDVQSRYTGKERDTESGNDYFGARYYASTVGRFMSPDWSAMAEPVPYSSLDNPQSLNLYQYVDNNPLSAADPDGHAPTTYMARRMSLAEVERSNAEFRSHPVSSIMKEGVLPVLGLGAYFTGGIFGAPALGTFGTSMLLRFAPLAIGAGAALQNSRNAVTDALGKLSSAAASGDVTLSPGTAGRLQSATNAVAEHLTDSDITGALRQAADGALHGGDHLQEVQATANSLSNLSQSLTGALNNPNVQGQARTLMQNAVNAMKPAIQQIKDLKKP